MDAPEIEQELKDFFQKFIADEWDGDPAPFMPSDEKIKAAAEKIAAKLREVNSQGRQ